MSLKSEPQNLPSNCFTCLRQSEDYIPIVSEPSDNSSTVVAELLIEHLRFQWSDFIAGHVICGHCWNQLNEFHCFYLEVEQNRGIRKEAFEAKEVESMAGDNRSLDEIQHGELILKEELDDGQTSAEQSSSDDKGEESDTTTNQSSNERDEIIKSHVQYTCTVCQKDCGTFTALVKHMPAAHDMLGCVLCCGKRFYRRQSLLSHVLKVQLDSQNKEHEMLDNKLYKCPKCDATRISKKAIIYHHQTRHGSDYMCDICDMGFISSNSLLRHKERKHPKVMLKQPENHQLVCEVCQMTFTSENNYRGHRRVHTGPKECDICGKMCSSASALSRHKGYKHPTKKCYDCEECGKSFPNNHNLYRHRKRSHKHPKPRVRHPKCEVCQKTFTNNNNYRSHKRLHTGPKQCDICGLMCSSAASLSTHKNNKHPRKKSYDCEACGKSYPNSKSISRHRKGTQCKGTSVSVVECEKQEDLPKNSVEDCPVLKVEAVSMEKEDIS